MEYFVSDKFAEMEKIGNPYEKNGKLYTAVRAKCDRCQNGVYVCRVENNRPVPHPAFGGVCLRCGGTGFIKHEVRLYTAKERAAADRAKVKAQERKQREQEQKDAEIRANAGVRRAEWLAKNGYGEDELTWIVIGDSYPVKDELKALGCRYDAVRGWYAPHPVDVPAGLGMVSIDVDKLIDFNYRGDGYYKTEAKAYVDSLKEADKQPARATYHYGTEGERITIPVIFTKETGFQGAYGWTNVYTFEYYEEDACYPFVWFTSTSISANVGDKITITGTIKKHDTYKDTNNTVLTRVKVK